jgi:hypothetical protein
MEQKMTGWRKRTIMEMAREVKMPYDFVTGEPINLEKLEAFADLVRSDERNRTWTQDHWTEYEHSIASIEREACAKVCDDYDVEYDVNTCDTAEGIAIAIRARQSAHGEFYRRQA